MKKTNSLKYLFTCCFCLLYSFNSVFSQAPANDECSGAILVNTNPYNDLTTNYTNGSTVGATRSIPDPACITSSDNNDDVWYKFVAVTQTELLRFHKAIADNLTFGYALYNGCGGTEMICNNNLGGFYGNELLGGLTPGNTYYLRFWSQFNFTSISSFSFAIMDINPILPANDPVNATQFAINEPGAKCIDPQFFTTASATRTSPNPSCNSDNDDDVWFQFVMPSNAVYIYVEEGALISSSAYPNMGMEIINASKGLSASCLNGFVVGSSSLFSSSAGDVIQLRLWTIGTANRAVFSICLQNGFGFKPDNDSCKNATNLVVGSSSCTNPVIGNLFNADITPSLTGNPSCTGATTLKNDVWYKAVVPASGNLVVQTSATNSQVNDLVMLAYTNNCNTFTQIACDEDGNPNAFPSANHPRISLTGRTPGETILYRVLPRNASNMGQFSICAFDETAPANPTISISNVNKKEGNAGTTQFNFTVSLSAPSTKTVKVKYKTADITATGGVDYVAVPTKILLTFNPGDTIKTIDITVNGDVDVESNETFKVKLSNAVNATLADSVGKGTIKNDDAANMAPTNNADNVLSQPQKNKITISPNPATDHINVELSLNNQPYNITLLDITGRLIRLIKVPVGEKVVSIKTNDLSRGIYLLKIGSGYDYQTFRFIKE